MLTREDVLKTIDDLPKEFSLDEIIDRLILLEKIDAGLLQSYNGETVSTDEAKAQLSKWLK
jgi:predicted transcriptional regulator